MTPCLPMPRRTHRATRTGGHHARFVSSEGFIRLPDRSVLLGSAPAPLFFRNAPPVIAGSTHTSGHYSHPAAALAMLYAMPLQRACRWTLFLPTRARHQSATRYPRPPTAQTTVMTSAAIASAQDVGDKGDEGSERAQQGCEHHGGPLLPKGFGRRLRGYRGSGLTGHGNGPQRRCGCTRCGVLQLPLQGQTPL